MRSRPRIAALGMALLLVIYLIFSAFYAVRLVQDPLPVVQAMGWALIVLPLIGAWALGAELLFGYRVEKLATRLEAEGGIPDDPLPAQISGRLEREAADAVFGRYAAEVGENPESWAHWFRLALAYDAARDRRRARWAMRQSIAFARASSAP